MELGRAKDQMYNLWQTNESGLFPEYSDNYTASWSNSQLRAGKT